VLSSLLLVGAFAALAVLLQVRGDQRARGHLDAWAQREGVAIVSATRRWLFTGTFWWRTSRAQRVYAITVADADGREHSGLARVGGWLVGALSSDVTVEWDRR